MFICIYRMCFICKILIASLCRSFQRNVKGCVFIQCAKTVLLARFSVFLGRLLVAAGKENSYLSPFGSLIITEEVCGVSVFVYR